MLLGGKAGDGAYWNGRGHVREDLPHPRGAGRGFVRGLGPCLLRAFPVNAAIFLPYEMCHQVADPVS